MVLKVPHESEEYPGKFEVLGYKDLLIMRDGRVFSKEDTLKELKIYKPNDNNRSYPSITLPGRPKKVAVHVLLALAFIPKGSGALEVNHIDGIKSNYRLDNLEWVTRSENIVHAFKHNLRTDNTPIQFKNLFTDEIKRFYSISECARYLNVSASTLIVLYLKQDFVTDFYMGRYIFRFDDEEWPDYDPTKVGEFPKYTKRPAKVTFEDGSCTYYEDMAFAAESIKITYSSIRANNRRHGEGSKYKNLVFEYVEDFYELDKIDPNLIHKRIQKKSRREKRSYFPNVPYKIEVLDLYTGKKEIWNSTLEFTTSLGLKKSSVQAAIIRKSGRFLHYVIRYLKEDSR